MQAGIEIDEQEVGFTLGFYKNSPVMLEKRATRKNVSPIYAARVLCGEGPLNTKGYSDSDDVLELAGFFEEETGNPSARKSMKDWALMVLKSETVPVSEVQHVESICRAVIFLANQKPSIETPAVPVPADPEPLTTGTIAFCFDGLRWTEKQWLKPLGDKPKWLQGCVVTPGKRGVSETRWNPVLIAARLVDKGYAQARSARAKFQTKPQLAPWLEAWKTYEADNFDTP
ncbi:MAG: hypothetical protein PWQ61_2517 [Betaproteobacteria bacterium]|nr:hypothetical protein [Betaproteobacteria bacterium]